jgi:hypothetical protein
MQGLGPRKPLTYLINIEPAKQTFKPGHEAYDNSLFAKQRALVTVASPVNAYSRGEIAIFKGSLFKQSCSSMERRLLLNSN